MLFFNKVVIEYLVCTTVGVYSFDWGWTSYKYYAGNHSGGKSKIYKEGEMGCVYWESFYGGKF